MATTNHERVGTAEISSRAPEQVVRTATEKNRTLKFTSQGFETE